MLDENTVVVDVVTGYTGKVTGHASYYGNRPEAYLVENVDSTGRPIEMWIDANRLQIL